MSDLSQKELVEALAQALDYIVLLHGPRFTLADILQAFADAHEHRKGAMGSCGDCRSAPVHRYTQERVCGRHLNDSNQALQYREMVDAFSRAHTNPDLFGHIAQIILKGDIGPVVTPAQADQLLAQSRQARDARIAAREAPATREAAPASAGLRENVGCIYVIEFSTGTIKVGRSGTPDTRLAAHRSDGRKYGAAIKDHWVSQPHAEWQQNEMRLIGIAKELGGTIAAGAEYFTGLAFADIAARAQDLPFTPSGAT